MALTEYEAAGVRYDVLDAAKRVALEAASTTQIRWGPTPLAESRGESAFVFRVNGSTMATVLECLGTKSVIARAYAEAGGPDLFKNIGFDAVSSVVNDLVSVGALPLVVNAYFATGSADWYKDEQRHQRLLEGWRDGCSAAGAVWGGGESPTLSGLVVDEEIEIAGSAVGFVPPDQDPILGSELAPGDEIIFVQSTGLHANGSSLVRKIAHDLPSGYRTPLPSGRELGEAVLDRSAMYVELVAALGSDDVNVTYYSHITGHGLRKLMRANKSHTYRIHTLLDVPEVLSEIQRYAQMDERAAYSTLNMGIGFVVFCAAGHGARVVEIAKGCKLAAVVAGEVESGPRRVFIQPLGLTFEENELQLRAGSG